MPGKKVFKAGAQSDSDPFEFVMSTSTPDAHGDVVVQDWDLGNFKKNPIALWAHNSSEPIGKWENVRVEGGKLMGRLKLAAVGTSDLIDTLRSLVEQRILKAVSVGFMPREYEPLDPDDKWGGYKLWDNQLFECSLCSVPANPEALSVAKAFTSAKPDMSEFSFAKQISQDSGKQPRTKKMPLATKIETKQKRLADLRDQLTKLDEGYDAENAMGEDVMEQYTELTEEIAQAEKELETLESAERALVMRASQQVKEKPPEEQGRIITRKNRKKGFFAFATVASMVKAFHDGVHPSVIAKSHFRDDPEVELLVKAATDPASMGDAAWAGALVQETWQGFLELIRDIAIYPRLPGPGVEFGTSGKINVPRNNGRGKLAGGWIGELNPIPVKEGAYDTVDLEPKKLGVITSFSKKIGMHSMPAIQGLLQNQMLQDTAVALDGYYLDNGARSTDRPAGIQDPTETGAANINASTGATVAAVLADLKGMISRMIQAYAGNSGVWLINPLNVLYLSILQDAASGEFVFRQELQSGRLLGYPMVSSQNVPEDMLVLQADQCMMYGNDYAPMINVSSETTLVFDDAAPEDIIGGGTPTAQPTKSMFQVDGIAIKLTLGLDWRIVRTNGIQVLTGVSW